VWLTFLNTVKIIIGIAVVATALMLGFGGSIALTPLITSKVVSPYSVSIFPLARSKQKFSDAESGAVINWVC